MSRHRRFSALLPVFLVVAGCGGSSGSVSTSTSSLTGAGSSTATTSRTQPASSSRLTAGATGSGRTRTRPTGGAGAGPASSSGGSPSGGSTNARVPATFTLGPGGKLTPASVSAPAFLAVAVTVGSTDSSAHQITLRTPTPHSFRVAARGHASMLVPGLRAGTYSVDVDGRPRAALIIGGEPGP